MLPKPGGKPQFRPEKVEGLVAETYGLEGRLRPLPSERDQNYLLETPSGDRFVLKIAGTDSPVAFLEAQNEVLAHLSVADPDLPIQRLLPTQGGEGMALWQNDSNGEHRVRLLPFLEGRPLADVRPPRPHLLRDLGRTFGRLDLALRGFSHPGTRREFHWDLRAADRVLAEYTRAIRGSEGRGLVGRLHRMCWAKVEAWESDLESGTIHNDGNDYNLLVEPTPDEAPRRVVGILDFGDMVESWVVGDLAVVSAYAVLSHPDPLTALATVAAGYNEIRPLSPAEIEVLFPLVVLRLSLSVTLAAYQRSREPDNEYLSVSEKPAWNALGRFSEIDPLSARRAIEFACRMPGPPQSHGESRSHLLSKRSRFLGSSLSVSYRNPLKIVRGAMQYLYDEDGNAYLDLVNNVCHVGHCHPKVVEAAQSQMALLNTNTRYLHDHLVEYAERLSDKFPAPLEVCMFVCSGSEANDLALRMAQTHTGSKEVITVGGAYHGNLSSLVDLSPYKYLGPGGKGRPPHVHEAQMPDLFRGPHRDPTSAGEAYAKSVADAAEESQGELAVFYCESLLGCGGQVVLPSGYLEAAYSAVRKAGGLCLADEVQVGFGRVGSHFWGFETQGVVPDLVTLGKPIGNGHPLAAVITTAEIAESFANGMEYFNTFGGNPVSCAIGLAVLNVIETEGLQENARVVGERLAGGLRSLQKDHLSMGDVRGLGLFLGIEFVRPGLEELVPDPELATRVVEGMKERGILLSTDGPDHNVVKIKPPLVVSAANVDFVVERMAEVLENEKRSG